MTHRTAWRGLSVVCAWMALGTLLSACGTLVNAVGEESEFEKLEREGKEERAEQKYFQDTLQHLATEDFQNELQVQLLMKEIAARPGERNAQMLKMLQEVDEAFHAHSGRRDCNDCDDRRVDSTP